MKGTEKCMYRLGDLRVKCDQKRGTLPVLNES